MFIRSIPPKVIAVIFLFFHIRFVLFGIIVPNNHININLFLTAIKTIIFLVYNLCWLDLPNNTKSIKYKARLVLCVKCSNNHRHHDCLTKGPPFELIRVITPELYTDNTFNKMPRFHLCIWMAKYKLMLCDLVGFIVSLFDCRK